MTEHLNHAAVARRAVGKTVPRGERRQTADVRGMSDCGGVTLASALAVTVALLAAVQGAVERSSAAADMVVREAAQL